MLFFVGWQKAFYCGSAATWRRVLKGGTKKIERIRRERKEKKGEEER